MMAQPISWLSAKHNTCAKSKQRVASSNQVDDYIFVRVLFYNPKSRPSIFVISTERSTDILIPQKLAPLLALGQYFMCVDYAIISHSIQIPHNMHEQGFSELKI
jgi:hypothetical protein